MALSAKQQNIYDFLKEKKEPTSKKDLVARFKGMYYANGEKHLGDLLQKMVKANILEQPKRGFYQIKKASVSNQKSLFDHET